MKFEKERVFVFYKRLISLYPQDFKERFGESMEQTFNDVCNEQKKREGKISVTFVFLTFAETSAGIIEENFHEIKGAFIDSIYLRIIYSIVIGLLTTAPFLIMEWIYSNGLPARRSIRNLQCPVCGCNNFLVSLLFALTDTI